MRAFRASLSVITAAALLAACDGSPSGGGQRDPARLDVVSGDLQTQATAGAELPQPLVVRVVDDRGRPVRNQLVNFVVTAGGGTVFAGSALTDRDGEARERWTLGTVAGDTQKVEARAVEGGTGRPLIFATFRAVARADAPFAIERMSPEEVTGTAGLPADSLAVRVKDKYGNVVPNAAVVWTVRSGGGSISPPQGATNAAGIAKARWTLGARLDSAQVAEAAAGLSLRAEFRATALPGATRLETVSGDSQSVAAGGGPAAQPLVVRVLGPDGQPVAGAVVRWEPSAGGVSPTHAVTDAQGRASTQWTLPAGRGTYFVRALYGPLQQTFWGSTSGTQPIRPRVLFPLEGAEVHGQLPVLVTCDECTRIAVELAPGGPVLTGSGSINQTVGLAGRPAGPLAVTVRGYDGLAVAATETRALTLRAAPTLQTVGTVPGHAQDYRPDRILYVDTTAAALTFKIRRVSTGADSLVGGAFTAGRGYLTDDGAVVQTGTTVVQLKDGAQTTLATGGDLRVNGGWAVWRSGQTLVRRDLAAGTTVTVATDASGDHAVGSNGDVAYRTATGFQVVRWRDGTPTTVGTGLEPRTDGGVVSFRTGSPGAQTVGVSAFDASGTTVLTPPVSELLLGTTSMAHAVRNGWVAFLRPAATGLSSAELWLRSPAGALQKVTPYCLSCVVWSVGENGGIAFTAQAWMYAWRPGGPLVQLRNDPSRGYTVVWVGSDAYALTGNTVSRVLF